ncbi:MAG: bifunctional 2-C-methyl-D-erythritol 4-phosphate cytidylyltransferase/2-C-methyl-D-erythritol 2,4-cyclodiphosphate synthase [Pseudomonadota bacterium]
MSLNAAIIVAAGRGSRFGSDRPKQYHPLAGRSVIWHSVQAFVECAAVDRVQVVIHRDDVALYESAVGDLITRYPQQLLPVIFGGATRQESVFNGLKALESADTAHVLIHDGARPLIERETIEASVAVLSNQVGAIVAVPVADTLKRVEREIIVDTVSRDGLWRAQTPQVFRFAEIMAAHRAAADAGDFSLTDDAAVLERAGHTVGIVPGRESNLKITTLEDLGRAETTMKERSSTRSNEKLDTVGGLMAQEEFRTGSGFDVHRFGPGEQVTLCGVSIPHTHGLVGHSDADVGLHVLVDALLGAIGAGDIGQHFPPTDDRWKGADSAAFLRHAGQIVSARGGRVVNVDVTIICERPKVGPYRDAMRSRIAEILEISEDRVNVKGTTTEKLGFTGRGEGIAGLASATVALTP